MNNSSHLLAKAFAGDTNDASKIVFRVRSLPNGGYSSLNPPNEEEEEENDMNVSETWLEYAHRLEKLGM